MSGDDTKREVEKAANITRPEDLDSSYVKDAYTSQIPEVLKGGEAKMSIQVTENHFGPCSVAGNKHWKFEPNGDNFSLQGSLGPCVSNGEIELKNPANATKTKVKVVRVPCGAEYQVLDVDGNMIGRSKEPTLVQRLINLFAGPFVGYTILTGVDAKDTERWVIRIPAAIKCPEPCQPCTIALCTCKFDQCKAACDVNLCKVNCNKCFTRCIDCKARCDECKLKCEACVAKCQACAVGCKECKIAFHEELLVWRPWDLEESHYVAKIEWDGFVNLCGQVIPGYTIKVQFVAQADVVDRAVLVALAFYADYHIMSHGPTLYPPHLLHKEVAAPSSA